MTMKTKYTYYLAIITSFAIITSTLTSIVNGSSKYSSETHADIQPISNTFISYSNISMLVVKIFTLFIKSECFLECKSPVVIWIPAKIRTTEQKSLIEVRRKDAHMLDFRRIRVFWGLSWRHIGHVGNQTP